MPRVFESDKDRETWLLMARGIELHAWVNNHVPQKELPTELLQRHMDSIATVTRYYDAEDPSLPNGVYPPFPGCDGSVVIC